MYMANLNSSIVKQPHSTVYIICIVPDGRLLMYRRILSTETERSSDSRTGWTITLRKDRMKEVDPRRTVRSMLFATFSLKDDVIDKLEKKLVCTHASDKTCMGHTEIFSVRFDETVSFKLSKQAEVKAASREEIMYLLENDEYQFTYETREIMNVVLALDDEFGIIKGSEKPPALPMKEKTNGSQI